jgi:hypothetical protein
LSTFPAVSDEALDVILEFIVERSPGSAAIFHAQTATDGNPRLRLWPQLATAKFFADEDPATKATGGKSSRGPCISDALRHHEKTSKISRK